MCTYICPSLAFPDWNVGLILQVQEVAESIEPNRQLLAYRAPALTFLVHLVPFPRLHHLALEPALGAALGP